jgi:hypothetical protein
MQRLSENAHILGHGYSHGTEELAHHLRLLEAKGLCCCSTILQVFTRDWFESLFHCMQYVNNSTHCTKRRAHAMTNSKKFGGCLNTLYEYQNVCLI